LKSPRYTGYKRCSAGSLKALGAVKMRPYLSRLRPPPPRHSSSGNPWGWIMRAGTGETELSAGESLQPSATVDCYSLRVLFVVVCPCSQQYGRVQDSELRRSLSDPSWKGEIRPRLSCVHMCVWEQREGSCPVSSPNKEIRGFPGTQGNLRREEKCLHFTSL